MEVLEKSLKELITEVFDESLQKLEGRGCFREKEWHMQRHEYRNYDVQWWQGVLCDRHEVQRQGGEIREK